MGDEEMTIENDKTNELRFKHIEDDVITIKDDIKNCSKGITEAEKSNIRMASDLKQTLAMCKIIKNYFLGFLVVNIIGIVWTIWAQVLVRIKP